VQELMVRGSHEQAHDVQWYVLTITLKERINQGRKEIFFGYFGGMFEESLWKTGPGVRKNGSH
jgi:hypothetical protein